MSQKPKKGIPKFIPNYPNMSKNEKEEAKRKINNLDNSESDTENEEEDILWRRVDMSQDKWNINFANYRLVMRLNVRVPNYFRYTTLEFLQAYDQGKVRFSSVVVMLANGIKYFFYYYRTVDNPEKIRVHHVCEGNNNKDAQLDVDNSFDEDCVDEYLQIYNGLNLENYGWIRAPYIQTA